MTNIEELQKLAEAATDGPWAVGETYIDQEEDGTPCMPETVVRGMDMRAAVAVCLDFGDNNPLWRDINAAFIAAANPAAIKELLSELTTLRAAASAPKAELTDELTDRAVFMREFPNVIWHEGAPYPEESWAINKWQGWRAKARTVLAQAAPVAVPEGWKLVPVEITSEMLEAIEDAALAETSVEWDSDLGSNKTFGDAEEVYRAMLAAAPAAPVARPSDDHLWDETLRDRDTYHEWADKLAEAISKHFGAYIGEHSNTNCPWAEALEVIENARPNSNSKLLAVAYDRFSKAVESGMQQKDAPVAAAVPAGCKWTPHSDEGGGWRTACGEDWYFVDGGPTENGMKHCHACGKPVELTAPAQETAS
jgi:hypothetical protein